MNIKITSDSTIDLPNNILEENNISLIPFNIILGDREYLDRINVTPDDIYKFVADTKTLPKTAAINEAAFNEFFGKYADEYDAVIYIALSSQISATYNNARTSAEGFSNVHVIDGKTLSTGTALLTLYAAELARAGLDAEKIVSRVEDAREHLQVSFVVDTMEYLHKGGRCSGLAAFVATRLNIKPTIIMHHDGKMRPGKKYIAKINKAIIKYVEDTLAKYHTPDLARIFITHTGVGQDVIDSVKKHIKNHFNFAEIIDTVAGCTITSHCGQGTLGILYVNKELER